MEKLNMQNTQTQDELLISAGLNWEVETQPIYDRYGREISGQRAIVRMDTREVFKIVSSKYTPFQNRALLSACDQFTETGGAKYSGARSYKNGARISARLHVPDGGFDVVKGDNCNTFLQLSTSHDGSAAIRIEPFIIRHACQNLMLPYWKRSECRIISARHTKDAANFIIKNAGEILATEIQHFRQYAEQLRELAAKEFQACRMESFLKALFEIEDAEEMSTRTNNQAYEIAYLVKNGAGQNINGVAGSQWAVYNGVTEFVSHRRGNDATAREYNALFGSGRDLSARAFELLASDKY